MKILSLFIIVVVAALLVSASASLIFAGDDGAWSYHNTSAWPGVCATGPRQSPVDLTFARNDAPTYIDSSLLPIQYHEHCHMQDFQIDIVNKHHTIDVVMKPSSTDCWLYDPTVPDAEQQGRKFSLLQFHFHTKAEHVIGAKQPWELHFVHNRTNDQGQMELLVIGVIGEQIAKPDIPDGQGQSRMIDQLLSPALLQTLDPKFSAQTITPSFTRSTQFTDIFPNNQTYVTYPGSLTTPPCSEVVTWIVFINPIKVWSSTIDAFSTLINRVEQSFFDHNFVGNDRPVQPYNNRGAPRIFAAPDNAPLPNNKPAALGWLYYYVHAARQQATTVFVIDGKSVSEDQLAGGVIGTLIVLSLGAAFLYKNRSAGDQPGDGVKKYYNEAENDSFWMNDEWVGVNKMHKKFALITPDPEQKRCLFFLTTGPFKNMTAVLSVKSATNGRVYLFQDSCPFCGAKGVSSTNEETSSNPAECKYLAEFIPQLDKVIDNSRPSAVAIDIASA